jgi:nitrate reductase gamma subunit
MNEIEVLNWLRGPGLQISVAVLVLGLIFRTLQNVMMGMGKDLAEPKGSYFGPGLATIARRSLFHPGTTYRGYFTMIAGYTFHIGLLVTLFFLQQHIMLFKNILGFGWPALPPTVIDIMALVSIAALITVLVHRVMDPVVRMLTDYQDYLAWLLTIAPLVTGYITMHPVGMSYRTAYIVHLVSIEILLVVIPFTKLSHMVSLFISRWYNGAIAGYRGAKS